MILTLEEKLIYLGISFVCTLASLLVPITYFLYKRLRIYPSEIYLMIALCELFQCFHLMISMVDLHEFLGVIPLDKVITFLTFNLVPEETAQFSFTLQLLWHASEFATLLYNIFLCIDLILVVRRPFSSGKSRRHAFHLLVAIFTMAYLIVETGVFHHHDTSKIPDGISILADTAGTSWITMTALFVCFIVWFYTTVSYFRRDFSNKESVKLYIKNHILYLFGLIFVFGSQTALKFRQVFLPNSDVLFESFWARLFLYLTNQSLPLLLLTLRLSDPFFKQHTKILLKRIFCCAQDKLRVEEDEVDEDGQSVLWNKPFFEVMNSTMSREILHYVLYCLNDMFYYPIHKHQASNEFDIAHLFEYLSTDEVCNYDNIVISDSLNSVAQSAALDNNLTKPLITNSGKSQIQVRYHAYPIFELLKRQDNITLADMLSSLDIAKNREAIAKAQESLGKSGSFFFFSHDGKFILKTIRHSELAVLKGDFLLDYTKYVALGENPLSMLARIYGAFTFQIEGCSDISLILMENTFSQVQDDVVRIYDLKGSLIGRMDADKRRNLSEKQLQKFSTAEKWMKRYGSQKGNAVSRKRRGETGRKRLIRDIVVGKDIDFLNGSDLFIVMEEDEKEEFIEYLIKDIDFLKRNELMDYSMLLGVSHLRDAKGGGRLSKSTNFVSFKLWRQYSSGNNRRYFSYAIIDYLQKFTTYKKLEYKSKAIFYKSRAFFVSCIEPITYGNRLLSFINSIIRQPQVVQPQPH